jgi:hypothetical protein
VSPRGVKGFNPWRHDITVISCNINSIMSVFCYQKRNIFSLALQPNSGLGRLQEISVSLQLLDLGQSVGLLGRFISSSQGLYLYTNTEDAHKSQALNIHAVSGIRTHGPGACASEVSSFLRPLGYRDQQRINYNVRNYNFACSFVWA